MAPTYSARRSCFQIEGEISKVFERRETLDDFG